MPHSHSHSHGGARGANRRRLALTLALSGAYMAAEIAGGLITNSLALLADAGHMFSDVAALGMSWFAIWIAERPPSPRRTFGYYRAEILAALANGATLIGVSIYIFIEAIRRFREPPEVEGGWMLVIASGGLAINLVGLALLHGGRTESLNVRSAWLHVLVDALGSIGAMLAGLLLWKLKWHWADPAASLAIGLLVMYSSWRLLADSISVLMESTPRHIDLEQVRRSMEEAPGALAVHDLHVWSITSGMDCLSAHVVVEEGTPFETVLAGLRQMLHDRFGIDHSTIQLEPPQFEGAASECS
jgi:cobalt-zinc-cadmium efflux system protein